MQIAASRHESLLQNVEKEHRMAGIKPLNIQTVSCVVVIKLHSKR